MAAGRRRRISAAKLSRNLRVCWLRDEQGLSVAVIARAERLSVRSVLRILAATRPLAQQAEKRRAAPDRLAAG